MTFTSLYSQIPKSRKVMADNATRLLVHGQGVAIFQASGPCSLIWLDASGTPGLDVKFTETNVLVTYVPTGDILADIHNVKGIVNQSGAYYWFSLDSQNRRLYAGIGEPRKETVIYQFTCEPHQKGVLEGLVTVSPMNATIGTVLRDPITRNVALFVKNTDEHTMDSIASGATMPVANLSLTAQKLHACISGKNFVLDGPEFPEFTAAIEHSIATPGKWCYERLKQKAAEFNKDKPDAAETYLRITLGENNGESPGIPYVMEIWPVGHYSPIHNHGGSTAVIRVLHGGIHVRLFPFLSGDEVAPFAEADFSRGDITWISPALNQVHQLKNLPGNKDTCITIQCYMYEGGDKTHYDYFDYLDADGGRKQFEPDSDMDFIEFKAQMKKEWAELRAGRRWSCFPKV